MKFEEYNKLQDINLSLSYRESIVIISCVEKINAALNPINSNNIETIETLDIIISKIQIALAEQNKGLEANE